MPFSAPLRAAGQVRDRVAVIDAGSGTTRFFLSADVAQRLSAKQDTRLDVTLGTGKDFGLLRLALTSAEYGLHCFRSGQQIAFNVRSGYLPREAPQTMTALPHDWRDEALVVDLTSLPMTTTETNHGTRRSRGRYSDLDPGYGDRDRGREEPADFN
jgi:hypothetical protein